jgi:thiamine-monophosphate kinase
MATRFGERAAIALLERSLGQPSPRVATGIGDDAAVLRGRAVALVWSVDACVEGVHFRRDWLRWEDVGFRSLQAAASDLAASAARPLAALSGLVLPRGFGARELAAFGRGQAAAARVLKCPVVGGNVSRGREFSVTTAVLGEAERPALRSGARPGHELWLVGEVGLAGAGQRLLAQGRATPRACIGAWRRPRALVELGLRLGRHATAIIDVSDGLAGDARRLAEASGVRVVIEQGLLQAVLRAELVVAARGLGVPALQLALYGGEDYALLATGAPRARPRYARCIGRIESGRGAVLQRATGGRPFALRDGFDHFGQ